MRRRDPADAFARSGGGSSGTQKRISTFLRSSPDWSNSGVCISGRPRHTVWLGWPSHRQSLRFRCRSDTYALIVRLARRLVWINGTQASLAVLEQVSQLRVWAPRFDSDSGYKVYLLGEARWTRSSARRAAPSTPRAVSRRDSVQFAKKSDNTSRPAGKLGQRWRRSAAGHFNSYRQCEPGLIGVGTHPSFAIGQRALLVCTPSGNVLWDCIAMLDPATITLINGLGGLKAIGISHPHFYTTMVEWSRAFGGVPIHLHADDHRWIMRPDPSIQLWNGETLELLPDVTLIRCGGHFPGGTVLHWAKGAGGRGPCARRTSRR